MWIATYILLIWLHVVSNGHLILTSIAVVVENYENVVVNLAGNLVFHEYSSCKIKQWH